ncbi:MAG: hypothetical protein J6X30_00940 [Clostridia bacterium]|nr:hypothetical protein [Clostridia bacterium]
MLENVPRYDMQKPPMRQHLRFLIRLLSQPDLIKHKNTLRKIGMEGINPPYLLLCNHNAFMDFKVASKAVFPHRANFVVAIDGFLKREWLLRFIGCICTRKFVNDVQLVMQLKRVIKRGDIAAIYPEARYSLCGTTAVLPDSIGKLAKFLGVPVVVLMCHGHHINSPFYSLPDHGVKGTQAEMTCIAGKDDVKRLSAEELNARIRKAFIYDDFAWQKENNVRVTYEKRAEGLHKVLYQCPHCRAEYRMNSEGTRLFCQKCGKAWEMDELGELHALEGETEFSHVPDWYEWERMNVRREVENGTYRYDLPVHVSALPNSKGYIDIGKARLVHDKDGFCLKGIAQGEPYCVTIPAADIYSCHIEYEYLGKYGDCVDLNTPTDTLYIYPEGEDFAVTKIALATEELYEFVRAKG